MNVTEKINKKVMASANLLAKKIVVQNANSACIWLAHQPEFPREAMKFKRTK